MASWRFICGVSTAGEPFLFPIAKVGSIGVVVAWDTVLNLGEVRLLGDGEATASGEFCVELEQAFLAGIVPVLGVVSQQEFFDGVGVFGSTFILVSARVVLVAVALFWG